MLQYETRRRPISLQARNARTTPTFDAGRPEAFHRALAHANRRRLAPSTPHSDWRGEECELAQIRLIESKFIERQREPAADRANAAPSDPEGFLEWFHALKENGPGQGDPLFGWLAKDA